MAAQKVFKRYELKYLLTIEQYEALKEVMKAYMEPNEYGKYRIHNIYMDTQDYLLIRRSIEKPCYKEKMRIRAYGNVHEGSDVFIELKKKYKGVVYKRRMDMTLEDAYEHIFGESPFDEEGQITKEIAYFMEHYEGLSPRILLSYDREAFAGKDDPEFRVTFDQNISMQDHDVCFLKEEDAKLILSKESVVLEVKTALGLPSWLLEFFAEHEIYKTSFSKYGTAYKNVILPQLLEEQALEKQMERAKGSKQKNRAITRRDMMRRRVQGA